MLLSPKIEEVSQNCFVFDVVKFKHWGRLAELLRFQAYRKTDRQTDRQIDRYIDRQLQLQQLQLPLHYTTATTTNANILRYIDITLH